MCQHRPLGTVPRWRIWVFVSTRSNGHVIGTRDRWRQSHEVDVIYSPSLLDSARSSSTPLHAQSENPTVPPLDSGASDRHACRAPSPSPGTKFTPALPGQRLRFPRWRQPRPSLRDASDTRALTGNSAMRISGLGINLSLAMCQCMNSKDSQAGPPSSPSHPMPSNLVS